MPTVTEHLPECGYVETLKQILAGKLEFVVLAGCGPCVKVTNHPDIRKDGAIDNPLNTNYIPWGAIVDITPATPAVINDMNERMAKAREEMARRMRENGVPLGHEPLVMPGMGSEKRGRS